MKVTLFILTVILTLQSCKQHRIFECYCGELYVKIETKCKDEDANSEFDKLMKYMDEMDVRGCECQETDGETDITPVRR